MRLSSHDKQPALQIFYVHLEAFRFCDVKHSSTADVTDCNKQLSKSWCQCPGERVFAAGNFHLELCLEIQTI